MNCNQSKIDRECCKNIFETIVRNRAMTAKFSSILLLSFILIGFTFISSGCKKNDTSTNYSTTPTTGGGGNTTSNEVVIQGMTFSPANINVTVGTTVTWTNKDSYAHTVTSGTTGSPSGLFDSGNLGSNGTFSFKFNSAGTFPYYCRIHSSMSGTITVK